MTGNRTETEPSGRSSCRGLRGSPRRFPRRSGAARGSGGHPPPPRRPHRRVGRGLAPPQRAAARPSRRVGGRRRLPVLPGRRGDPVPLRRGGLREPVPVVRPRAARGASARVADGDGHGARTLRGRPVHPPARGVVRRARAARADARARRLDRSCQRALGRPAARVRARVREPRRRGRRHAGAPARADLRPRAPAAADGEEARDASPVPGRPAAVPRLLPRRGGRAVGADGVGERQLHGRLQTSSPTSSSTSRWRCATRRGGWMPCSGFSSPT